MAFIKIDGAILPTPSLFKEQRFDLDSGDTNRNERGFLQRDRVRQGIYKIEMGWNAIESSALQLIETAIIPSSIKVTFPSSRGMITRTMYVGDRKKELVKWNEDYNKIRWDISFNLTEY